MCKSPRFQVLILFIELRKKHPTCKSPSFQVLILFIELRNKKTSYVYESKVPGTYSVHRATKQKNILCVRVQGSGLQAVTPQSHQCIDIRCITARLDGCTGQFLNQNCWDISSAPSFQEQGSQRGFHFLVPGRGARCPLPRACHG